MHKIAVLFSGTGTNLRQILKTMHNKEVEVALALTNNPNAKGIQYAREYNIPLEIIDSKEYKEREEFDRQIVNIIETYDVKLIVLAGFMRILTPVFTDNLRAINLHPSLLPRHKGLHAIEKSYEDKHPDGGVTTHFVTSDLDGGEIILQYKIPKKNLSLEQYIQQVKNEEQKILPESIRKILL